MNKSLRLMISAVLLCTLIPGSVLPVLADEPEKSLSIDTADDFLEFTDNCLLDAYSENLTVSLTADLDLSNQEFRGIPIFCGTFEGNGHLITGISISADGSGQGFFRYLTENARVQNLTVIGKIIPDGTRRSVGGLAGENSGTILNCCFRGELSGSEYVGGLVGINQVSGILENCCVSGAIHGNHFVGGLAGKNSGVIRGCINQAGINTTACENSVALSDINAHTITGTESADTVTDVGGIAGTSSGVIRSCENFGTVGYQHMGYNIGGITGSQKGYITECTNHSNIWGRKEIAGITGQMEPVSTITYSEDTLQILRQQLADTSSLAGQASTSAEQTSQALKSQMSSLRSQADAAADAVSQLLNGDGQLPDKDTIQAAKNTLTSSLSSMQNTASQISTTAQSGVSSAAGNIRALSGQIDAISKTLANASEHLGGTITDISDLDTPEDLTGKISLCTNLGSISGDLNAGGIAGAIAWENDLNPEEDFQVSGKQSLNFNSEMRAVILDCSNSGRISVKKRNAGGIVGSLSMGLVKGCSSTGFLDAAGAGRIGGIAGTSSGYIRQCSSKCEIKAAVEAGGIAGTATAVSDCRSLVHIMDGKEKLGSVIGSSDIEAVVSGNYYLPLSENLGAVDGINYRGAAEALNPEQFLGLNSLPDIFSSSTLHFRYEDGTEAALEVPLGETPNISHIPELPEKDNFEVRWKDLDISAPVYFDSIFVPEAISFRTVLESNTARQDSRPLLLAEGQFGQTPPFSLTPLKLTDSMPENTVEAWIMPTFSTGHCTQLRFAVPETLSPGDAQIYVRSEDKTWHPVPCSVSGSYVIFTPSDSDYAFALVQNLSADTLSISILLGAAAVILTVVLIVVLMHRRHRKQSKNV